MKTVIPTTGLLSRLGAIAALLLTGHQALAVGTDAGTVIENTASVAYTVGSTSQTAVPSNTVSFVVDRVVTFELQEQGGTNTTIDPGEIGAITVFTLTNTSNSPLDLALSADNLADGTIVNTETDGADMTPASFSFRVANGDGAGGTPDASDLDFVDALPEGETVVIHVLANAPAGLTDGQVANIELTATAHDPFDGVSLLNPSADGNLGAILTDGAANTDAGIENVFNEDGGSGDGADTAQDGYTVEAATLTVTKVATILDPFGGDLALPDAVITYAVTIANAGAATATSVTLSDVIDDSVNLENDTFPGNTNVSIDDGVNPLAYCTADADNSDGCTYDVTNPRQIDVTVPDIANGGSVTITFQVRIPNT